MPVGVGEAEDDSEGETDGDEEGDEFADGVCAPEATWVTDAEGWFEGPSFGVPPSNQPPTAPATDSTSTELAITAIIAGLIACFGGVGSTLVSHGSDMTDLSYARPHSALSSVQPSGDKADGRPAQ